MRFADLTEISWDGHDWTGTFVLRSWRGFQTRKGSYGSMRSKDPSDGTVSLVLRGAEQPTAREEKAVLWLMQNEGAVQKSMLEHLKQIYPALREQYNYGEGDPDCYMPDVGDEHDFRGLIGLHSVFIHPLQREGLPYLGFEFGCTWDNEHGLGFMMHGDRVVDCGGADTSFLLWIAKKDAEEA